VDACREFLRPGDVVIDVGGWQGDTALRYGFAVGTTGAVIVFEPNRYIFPVLAANAELNRDKVRIIPCPFAAGEKPGKMIFEYGDPGFNNGGRHEGISPWRHGSVFKLEVEAVRLDDYVRQHYPDLVDRLRFVKIDAEGYDRFVLESMRDLVTRTKPFLLVEVNKHNTRPQRLDLLGLLDDLGYGAERVLSDTELHGDAITADNVMAWKHYDVFCRPRASPGGPDRA
jgi:FkbM family methyltransferase